MLRRSLLFLGSVALLAAQPVRAAPELEVKAVFLAKFPAYVTWPPQAMPKNAFSLCVVGQDRFRHVLDRAVAGLEVEGHPITVRRYREAASADQCQIAYLAGSPHEPVAKSLRVLAGLPILTVTDEISSDRNRGVIHYVIKGGRVRFHIDSAAARRSGLTLKSTLLGIALSVKDVP